MTAGILVPASAVAELGCDTAQGFHVSRPLPEPVLVEWLRKRGSAPESPTLRLVG